MEHWQFLIQEQGDRSWRPLESPKVEIIEGRYRVVARTNHTNMDVEVRVTHSSTSEVPPKRRINKRSRRTNLEGLMAVIPFTYLKPGVWELQCSGDLMSDLLGKSWQHSVYLRVFAQETESAITKGENQKEYAIIDQPVSPVWLKGETAEHILQNLIELAIPASEPLLEDETKFEDWTYSLSTPLVLTLDEETVVASRGQTLTINGRVELKETTNLNIGETSDFARVYGGELQIELRSPQGLEILSQVRQSLPEKLLPLTIRSAIEVPANCESKLILADISLYGALASGREATLLANQSFTITADVTELLAISAAANKPEPDIVDDLSAPPAPLATDIAPPSVPLNLELFNLVKTPKTDLSLVLHPSKKSLPPQIEMRSSLHKSAASASAQLPKLPPHQNKMITPAAVVSEPLTLELSEKDDTIATVDPPPKKSLPPRIDLRALHIARIGTTLPYLRRIKALPTGRELVKSNTLAMLELQMPDRESQQQGTTTAQNEQTAQLVVSDAQFLDNSFNEQTAQLVVSDAQFLDNSFNEQTSPLVVGDAQFLDDSLAEVAVSYSSELITTEDPYSSPLIKKWMHSQGYSLPEPIDLQYQDYDTYVLPSSETIEDTGTKGEKGQGEEVMGDTSTITPSSPPLPQLPPPRHAQTSSARLAQEIVVDDISEAEADTFKSHPSKQEEKSVSDFLPIATGIPEQLPIPQLHLPEGELISGKSVRVRVQLAQRCPQVAVKLWLEDCQTRWLLDGPRLLTNLLPNALGGLEEMTHINVPFGCLEIRLEAIAVNMTTQQESHKVTILRTVIPPDLPTLQVDELFLFRGVGE